jgi:hypothetical protein
MDLKAIGQIAATLSVILSLGFVGYELRQNTAVAQFEAYTSFLQAVRDNEHLIASDPIITPLLVRVAEGAPPEDFTLEEQFRLRATYQSLLRLWEGLFRSVQLGILPQSTLGVVGTTSLANPYFRSTWPNMRGSFSPEFVVFVEGLGWASP